MIRNGSLEDGELSEYDELPGSSCPLNYRGHEEQVRYVAPPQLNRTGGSVHVALVLAWIENPALVGSDREISSPSRFANDWEKAFVCL